MNKLVATLATTTVLFAASSAYLGYRLYERGAARDATASTAPEPNTIEPHREKAPAVATAPPQSTAVRESVIDLEADGRQLMADRARKMLPDFDDPQKRQKLLDDAKVNLRRTYRDLGKYLGIGTDAEDQLFEMLATLELRQMEDMLRCALETGCRIQEVGRGRHELQLQEMAALIGPDKAKRFEEFQMSMSERMSMVALRGRFDDATRLTDDQTERLIKAVAEVRQRAEGDLALRNAGISEYGGGVLGFVYSGDGTDPDTQLAEAREYGERLRERAAQILDKAQLKIFDDAREETLRSLELTLRQAKSDSG